MKRVVSWILVFLMVVSCVPANALAAYAAPGYTVSQECVIPFAGSVDGDELLDGYIYQLFYGNAVTYGRKAGDQLTGNTKILYDALVPIIRQIAAGERSSTVIRVGQTIETAEGLLVADAEVSFVGTNFDLRLLISALLTDLPYELYWYDKTDSTRAWMYNGQNLEQVHLEFPVPENYQGSEAYSVDCKLARAAAAAAKNSAAIVSKYADDTDYEKLLGYKQEICLLTSYDEDAAMGGYFSQDSDPWQLIHVFDGDETTMVVCEGYSKAFAYLCEQTSFAGDVSCITVSGMMGGGHMWNIVTLEGKNYLVDVTNSDGLGVGRDGSLFLAGGTGSIAEGYWVGEHYYAYVDYSGELNGDVALWGDGPDSILNLASERYVPTAAQIVASGNCTEQISWSLDETGTLTVSGTGKIPDYPLYGAPWYREYKDSVKKVVVEVRDIGDYVFAALPNLKRVTLTASVVTVGTGAFQDCTALTDLYLTLSLWSIGAYGFAGCSALENVEIPMLTYGIGDFAFYGCSALRKINFPFQMNNLGVCVFEGCDSLEKIQVVDENKRYSSDASGALYNKDKTALIKVPGAYSGHYVIPDTVTVVEAFAFSDCDGLTAVTIPAGVTAIGENAFGGCTGLADVYYTDTASKWQQIQISQGNAPLLDGTLHSVQCQNHQSVQYPAKAPTCTEPGWDAYQVCTECGHSNYQEIPATGHTLYPYTGKNPTCTEPGWEAYGICEYCDYTTYQEIPATGHSAVAHAGKPATCTEYGWEPYETCLVCDHSTYEQIPAAGHSYEDIICTVCGTQAAVLDGGACGSQLSWQYRDGGILEISGTGDMDGYFGQVTAPWYSYARDIKTVLIREGVTSVGENAFSGCVGVTNVTVPESLTDILASAFDDCVALEYNLYNGIKYLGTADNPYHILMKPGTDPIAQAQIHAATNIIADEAFYDCQSLTSVTVPGSVACIGEYAFAGCTGLTSLTIENSVQVIGDGAFNGCSALTDLAIPDSVTAIGAHAFGACTGLTSVKMGRGVKTIGNSAFSTCIGLSDIVIGENVTTIGKSAFFYCTGLTSVTLPLSVGTIGNGAFGYCTNLQDVYYWGNARQWSQISIEASNGKLETANLHFNAGHVHDFEDLVCTHCGCKKADPAITSVTLRPDCAGVYYDGSFDIKEGIEVARKGIAVSVYSQLPVADETDPYSFWTEGTTSVLVTNILDTDQNATSNGNRAAMPIYARAYVQLADGTYIYSDVVAMNLQQVVEAADARWNTLGSTQKTELSAMYSKFYATMYRWNIPNLMSS